jgi:RND family efflux transporter MFP subunit
MSKKILIPLLVGIVLFGGSYAIFKNPPQAGMRKAPPMAKITVEVETLARQDYPITLSSYGEAKAATQSMLVSQVAGQIVAVNEAFRSGSSVKKGDILVNVDDRDYRTAVMSAEANLLDAERSVVEERARAKQAALDWKTLGRKDEPNDLVLRKPQLMAAEARLKAAQADLSKANLALERTQIRAPFDGRVLDHKVDVGQFINVGTAVAELYANDYVEVRLPLCNCDLDFIDLDLVNTNNAQPRVTFFSNLNSGRQWSGVVSRVDSAIDSNSRQLHVIGRIDQTLADSNLASEIKIGEYLTAEIQGKLIKDTLIIPNKTIYQSSFVYIVEKGTLQRRDIEILWQNNDVAMIGSGLESGDQLVLTSLGQVTSGTRVSIAEQQNTSINIAGQPPSAEQGAHQ